MLSVALTNSERGGESIIPVQKVALREFLGNGTLLGGIDMVFAGLQPIQLLPESYPGFLLAMLPPGAFILLGCMIAWKNWLDARAAARAQRKPPQAQPAAATN